MTDITRREFLKMSTFAAAAAACLCPGAAQAQGEERPTPPAAQGFGFPLEMPAAFGLRLPKREYFITHNG